MKDSPVDADGESSKTSVEGLEPGPENGHGASEPTDADDRDIELADQAGEFPTEDPTTRASSIQPDTPGDFADASAAGESLAMSRLRAFLRSKARWLLIATGALLTLSLAITALWWNDQPSLPSERLGVGQTASPAVASLEEDLEQQAFLERRRREAAADTDVAEAAPGERVTLTDRSLVDQLRGGWIFEIGGGRVLAEFANRVVRRVNRGPLLVELFEVESRTLPPFFTTLMLPERGTFLVFSGADGEYQLVLEDIRSHGADLLSFRLSDSNARYRAFRAIPSEARDRDTEARESAPESPRRPRSSPVEIIVDAPPPATDMWRRAQALREQDKLHSLQTHLRRMVRFHPRHSGARRWLKRSDRWIREQERNMTRAVQRRLRDLTEAIEDRDLDEIFEQWDDRPDGATRAFFRRLLADHERIRSRTQLQTVDVSDGVAQFRVTVTLEVSTGGRVDIQPYPWLGTLKKSHFSSPFP